MIVKRNPRGYRVGATHHRAKYSSEQVARARELRANGLSYAAIGICIGANGRTVYDWLTGRTRYAG